jgi:hypothetical protein
MLRPARPARSLSAAVVGAAVAAALLVVPAHAAPAPSGSSAVRVVTPPTQVSRAALVRLMRHVGKATDKGLVSGARIRTTLTVGTMTTTTTGRTVDGRAATRSANGAVLLTDYRTGRGYAPIADVVEGLDVTPEQLTAALTSLGKPGATWAVISDAPAGAAGTGSDLVRQARAASTWTWKRAHGVTTWRLGAPRAALPTTSVVALDRRQRIVRESLTVTSTRPLKLTTRVSVRLTYTRVAPITLPTDAQSVDLDALLEALAAGGDAGTTPPVRVALAAQVDGQIAVLRSAAGR